MILNKVHTKRNPDILIGNDVWIGANVLIMPGVKIGNGVIIGAGAVVIKDIPDYAIAVGIPAKVIKYRFNDQQIKLLNEVQWWNWDDDFIKAHINLFKDNELFFEHAKQICANKK